MSPIVHIETDPEAVCVPAIVTRPDRGDGIVRVTAFTDHGSGVDSARRMVVRLEQIHDPIDCPDPAWSEWRGG